MASQHSHYPPGPSTYHPSPPPLFGNPPYPLQYPQSSTSSPHASRTVNGVGRAAHQGPGHPIPTYYPPFAPYRPYPPNFYPPLEHQHHMHPPYPPNHQQHINDGAVPMARPPSGPNQQTHLVRTHPPTPFSPPFHPHGHPYLRSSPGISPSALPKQLLSPSPSSHIEPKTLPQGPAPSSQPDPPPPPVLHQQPPTLETSPSRHEFSSLISQHPPFPQNDSSAQWSPSTPVSSRSVPSPQDVPEPYQILPDRTNTRKGFSVKSRRPNVLDAVAVTVSVAARPPPSFYVLTASAEDESVDPLASATVKARTMLSSLPLISSAISSKPATFPDSPQQQSFGSSTTTTTTPPSSTAPDTPMPGSPLSSITSVSLPAKSPLRHNIALASPSLSLKTISTDGPTEAVPSETVQKPTPPLLKPWVSLFHSQSASSPSAAAISTNKLPTSSVRGFSIPASVDSEPPRSHSNPALVALLTSTNALTDRAPPIRPRGLVNLGNMCFANTVLQVLVYCPPFRKLYMELGKYMLGKEIMTWGSSLTDATVTFMKEFQVLPPPAPSTISHEEVEDESRDSFMPSYVYDALKEKKRFDSMRGGQQEDAEEFLGFYLDTLEEELVSMITSISPGPHATATTHTEERVEEEVQEDGWLEVGKRNKSVLTRTHKSLESPISRIFSGRFRTILKVPGARESVMVDPWSRLQLDIQPDHICTIEDALRNIATPGTVQMMSSSRPGVQIDATQQTLIDALPQVLVLHLKRFLYDTTVKDVVKLSKNVKFGTELEITKDVITSARRSKQIKYKLFGVLNHHGNIATGGHYTLDVLHSERNHGDRWIRIDDEFVQEIQVEDLPVRDIGDDRSAYLLFYRRVLPPGLEMRV